MVNFTLTKDGELKHLNEFSIDRYRNIETPNMPIEKTPDDIAFLIKDLLKDKVVCDVGCGDGDFMQSLSAHAKEVKGVEELKERGEKAEAKGFQVTNVNSLTQELPTADVYYLFSLDAIRVFLKARKEGKKGTFIFGNPPRREIREFIMTLNPEVRRHETFTVFIVTLK